MFRHLLLGCFAAGAFLAPFALHASVGDGKRHAVAPSEPLAAASPATDAISQCDARPWLNAASICLRPATLDEPPRLVRIVAIERLSASSATDSAPSALAHATTR